jgi:thiol-disulfide isomerase/thioredoxin
VVNLWATWCVPCRRELPAFDEVAGAAGDDLDVFGVNVGDDVADARDLVDELELTFPQLHDPTSSLTADLGAVQMPTTAFLDADGDLVEVHAGAYTVEELVDAVEDHLGVTVDAS